MAKYKIKQARAIRKHSKKAKTNIINSRPSETIEAFLNNLNKHKAALSLLAVATSVIISTIWNITCQCAFKGYADCLGIDSRYIQINYNDILINLLIAFGITFVCATPIYRLAQYNAAHHIDHWKPMVYSVIAIALPYIAAIVIAIGSFPQNIAMYILIPLLIIGIISAVFLMLYCLISSFFYDKKNIKKPQMKTDATMLINLMIKRLLWLIVGVIILLVAIYFLGWVAAKWQRAYKLIVDDHNTNIQNSEVYHVILAENDDYYYLADCNISSTSDETLVLNIMNNNITIEAKSEITHYRTIHFSDVDIKDTMP